MTVDRNETSVFASRIDGWLLVLIVGGALACSVAAAVIVVSSAPGPLALAVLTVLVGAVFPVWLLVATRYALTDDVLRVRCGPFHWKIPLADIKGVTPTRNPLSSPALSLDRLRIDYGEGRRIMISPLEKERFVRELEQRRMRARGR